MDRRWPLVLVEGGAEVELNFSAFGRRYNKPAVVDKKFDKIRKLSVPIGDLVNDDRDDDDHDGDQQESSLEDYLNDQITLILWFKDQDPTPIYTIDARQVSLGQENSVRPSQKTALERSQLLLSGAKHYPARSRYKSSADLSEFPLVRLKFKQAEAADSGRYKCRVDFKRSPTVNEMIELLVKGKQSRAWRLDTLLVRAKV